MRAAASGARLGETNNWSMILSGGEQQRLAFARALLYRPDWLFLDEATSALDEAAEQRMYELLRERLPDATVLSIAHRFGAISPTYGGNWWWMERRRQRGGERGGGVGGCGGTSNCGGRVHRHSA